jgi:hypothetical protein
MSVPPGAIPHQV